MEVPKYPGLSIIRVFLSIKSLEMMERVMAEDMTTSALELR